jgi:hypothetical protein
MKNVIAALVLCLVCSSAYASSCSSGSCGSRVVSTGRTAVVSTVGACRRVVSAPVRVTGRVRVRSSCRRSARVARRSCSSCN